ncbi:MAG: PQQ-binding-like beta-propeller repeat protein, partial [Verrucomicrobiota bacterium]
MKRTTCFLLLAFSPWPAHAANWDQWRGPDRSGYVADSTILIDELPADGLKPVWQSEAIESGRDGNWSSPIVADGKVYLFVHQRTKIEGAELPKRQYPWLAPNKRGHLTPAEYKVYEENRRDEDERLGENYTFKEIVYCLDEKTGKTLWENEKKGTRTRFVQSGTLTLHEGRLYVLGAPRTLRCIDTTTTKTVWETRLPGDFRDEFYSSCVAVADNTAVLLAGRLFGVDIENGDILWTGDEEKTSGAHSSPVVWSNDGHDLIIVNAGPGDTVCLEPRTGKERWRIDSGAKNSTPVIVKYDR